MTDKRQKVTRSNVYKIYPLQNSQYLWNMFFFRWSIWIFLHLLHKNSRKKHKLENLHLEPHDYQIKINKVISMVFVS